MSPKRPPRAPTNHLASSISLVFFDQNYQSHATTGGEEDDAPDNLEAQGPTQPHNQGGRGALENDASHNLQPQGATQPHNHRGGESAISQQRTIPRGGGTPGPGTYMLPYVNIC